MPTLPDILSACKHSIELTLFSGESDERYVSARDCLEKFIMTKLGVYAFKSVEDPAEDALLMRRMKLLSFLEPNVSYSVQCLLGVPCAWQI